jgi:dihydrodipicolinate synthase/N-acetylneuraminate lyase
VPGCASFQEEIEDLSRLLEQGHWLPALKAACSLLGLGSGVPAAPLLPAGDAERRAIAAILRRHRLLDARVESPDAASDRRPGAPVA